MKDHQTYNIITFGCQMNKSESERLASVLESLGYQPEPEPDRAKVVILNACSVRQSAIDRIWGYAKNLNEAKTKGGVEQIILTGCLLVADKQKLSPKFDLVFNIKDIKRLVDHLRPQAYQAENYFDILPRYGSSYQAFVPIMTGCDNFCTYCCVPFTRGREQYRSVNSILTEINFLTEHGCHEITLLGQNVNTYKPSDPESFNPANPYQDNFAKLLWEVDDFPAISRINFTSAHPKDMNDEVIDCFKLPSVMNYLHLALQSGDNHVLHRMNRKYTTADYYQIVEKLRRVKPDLALGTDLIVGFPGETEAQFQNTCDFYQKVGFDISYHAMYSPRVGTPATRFQDQVEFKIKKRRWHQLQRLMEEITLEKNQKYLGRTVSVLVDRHHSGYCEGNSREMKRVRFFGSADLTGQIIKVKISKAMTWLLTGQGLI